MPSEAYKKERRDIKRLKEKVANLEKQADDLSARNNGLRMLIDRLTGCLSYYACDCPDFRRHDCTRQPCGMHATELLDEVATTAQKN